MNAAFGYGLAVYCLLSLFHFVYLFVWREKMACTLRVDRHKARSHGWEGDPDEDDWMAGCTSVRLHYE